MKMKVFETKWKSIMNLSEEIKGIEKLLEEGKHTRALKSIKQLEKKNDLSHDKQIEIFLLKSNREPVVSIMWIRDSKEAQNVQIQETQYGT